MNNSITSNTSVVAKILSSTNRDLMAAVLVGLVVVLAVGFAPMDVAHNAAHDARHALAFPCH